MPVTRSLADDLAAREQTFKIRQKLKPGAEYKPTPLQAWRQAADDVKQARPIKPLLARLRQAKSDTIYRKFSYAGTLMNEYEMRVVANSLKQSLIVPVYRTCLRELDLRNCDIDYGRSWWLAKGLAGNASLVSLNLRGNPLCSEGVEAILRGLLSGLRLLDDFPPDASTDDEIEAMDGHIAASTRRGAGKAGGGKGQPEEEEDLDPYTRIRFDKFGRPFASPHSTGHIVAGNEGARQGATMSPFFMDRAKVSVVELGMPPATPSTPHGSHPPATSDVLGLGPLPPLPLRVRRDHSRDRRHSDGREGTARTGTTGLSVGVGGTQTGEDGETDADGPHLYEWEVNDSRAAGRPPFRAQTPHSAGEGGGGGGGGGRPGTGGTLRPGSRDENLSRGKLLNARMATGLSREQLMGPSTHRAPLGGLPPAFAPEASIDSEPSVTAAGTFVPFLDDIGGRAGLYLGNGLEPETYYADGEMPSELDEDEDDGGGGPGRRAAGSDTDEDGDDAVLSSRSRRAKPGTAEDAAVVPSIPASRARRPMLGNLDYLTGPPDQLASVTVGTTALAVRGSALYGEGPVSTPADLASARMSARTQGGEGGPPTVHEESRHSREGGTSRSSRYSLPAGGGGGRASRVQFEGQREGEGEGEGPLSRAVPGSGGDAEGAWVETESRLTRVPGSAVPVDGTGLGPAFDPRALSSQSSRPRTPGKTSGGFPIPPHAPHPSLVKVGVDLPDPSKGGRAAEEREAAIAREIEALASQFGGRGEEEGGPTVIGSKKRFVADSPLVHSVEASIATMKGPLKVNAAGFVVEQPVKYVPVSGPRGAAGPSYASTTPVSRLRYLNLANTHIGLSALAASTAFRMSDVTTYDGRGVSALGEFLSHPSCGLTNLNMSKNVLPSGVTEKLLACLDTNTSLEVLGVHDLPGSGPPLAAALVAKAAGLSLSHGRAALADDRLGLGTYTGRVVGSTTSTRMLALMSGGTMGTGGSWVVDKKALGAGKHYGDAMSGGKDAGAVAERWARANGGVPDGPQAAINLQPHKVAGGRLQREGSVSSLAPLPPAKGGQTFDDMGSLGGDTEDGGPLESKQDGSGGAGMPVLYKPPARPILSPEELVYAARDALGPFMRNGMMAHDPSAFSERVRGVSKVNLCRCNLGDVGALAVAVVLMAAARSDLAERAAYYITRGRDPYGRRLRTPYARSRRREGGPLADGEDAGGLSSAAGGGLTAARASSTRNNASGDGEEGVLLTLSMAEIGQQSSVLSVGAPGSMLSAGTSVIAATMGGVTDSLLRVGAPPVRHGVKFLKLRHNAFGALSLRMLARALKVTHTLVKVDLSSNPLGSAGARVLARLLEDNDTVLQELRVDACELTDNGKNIKAGVGVVMALAENRSLVVLSLRHNCLVPQNLGHRPPRVQNEIPYALPYILGRNVSLRELDLRDNAIGLAGAASIQDAVSASPHYVAYAGEVADVLTRWLSDGLKLLHPRIRPEQNAGVESGTKIVAVKVTPPKAGALEASSKAGAEKLLRQFVGGGDEVALQAAKAQGEKEKADAAATAAAAAAIAEKYKNPFSPQWDREAAVHHAKRAAAEAKLEASRARVRLDTNTESRLSAVGDLIAASKSGRGAVSAALALLQATEPAWVSEAAAEEAGKVRPNVGSRALGGALRKRVGTQPHRSSPLQAAPLGTTVSERTGSQPPTPTTGFFGPIRYPRVVLALQTTPFAPAGKQEPVSTATSGMLTGVQYTAADGGSLPLTLVMALAGASGSSLPGLTRGAGGDSPFTRAPDFLVIKGNPHYPGAYSGEVALPKLDFTRLGRGSYGGISAGNAYYRAQGGRDDVEEWLVAKAQALGQSSEGGVAGSPEVDPPLAQRRGSALGEPAPRGALQKQRSLREVLQVMGAAGLGGSLQDEGEGEEDYGREGEEEAGGGGLDGGPPPAAKAQHEHGGLPSVSANDLLEALTETCGGEEEGGPALSSTLVHHLPAASSPSPSTCHADFYCTDAEGGGMGDNAGLAMLAERRPHTPPEAIIARLPASHPDPSPTPMPTAPAYVSPYTTTCPSRLLGYAGDPAFAPGEYTLRSGQRAADKGSMPLNHITVRTQTQTGGAADKFAFPVHTLVQLRGTILRRVFAFLGEKRRVLV